MKILLLLLNLAMAAMAQQQLIGVNWGTQLSHPLPPVSVVRMLKANNVGKVKLFDADPSVMKALSGSNLEVMVGIPNDMLQLLSSSSDAADRWVQRNVSNFIAKVDIKYVAVGNEPFLTAYNKTFETVTLPALKNVQASLARAGLGDRVKATVPLNADVLENPSSVPSKAVFRTDIQGLVLSIVSFLNDTGAPFTMNLYPFISLQQDSNFPRDFAFFGGNGPNIIDGSLTYTNVFDASYDSLVAALVAAGFPSMLIIVGEVGWPTDGDINANVASARQFNQGLLQHVLGSQGTPQRPQAFAPGVYLFSLVDEDQKSIAPGNFERHWGIFTYDGQAKYLLDTTGKGDANSRLSNVKGVEYLPARWCVLNSGKSVQADSVSFACSRADCTALSYGSSCNSLDATGNASYAFNSYYQVTDQKPESCNFQGYGTITTKDPSTQTCRFIRQIMPADARAGQTTAPLSLLLLVAALNVILI